MSLITDPSLAMDPFVPFHSLESDEEAKVEYDCANNFYHGEWTMIDERTVAFDLGVTLAENKFAFRELVESVKTNDVRGSTAIGFGCHVINLELQPWANDISAAIGNWLECFRQRLETLHVSERVRLWDYHEYQDRINGALITPASASDEAFV